MIKAGVRTTGLYPIWKQLMLVKQNLKSVFEVGCSAVGWLLFLVISTTATADESRDCSATGPNVVLIIADDLTASALSCYGSKVCRTPNIDRLAASGMRFNKAYCQFPVCGPSRAAMMSGMYCESIGVLGNGASSKFSANLGARPSMSQHFKNQGWHTTRVSKIYHMRVPGDITAGVDGPDHLESWTERFNCRGPEWMSKGTHEHLTNEKLKRDPDKHYNLGFGGAFYSVQTRSPIGEFQPDRLAANHAIRILQEQQQKKSKFFLAVGLVRPHVPLVAPPRFFSDYPAAKMKMPPAVANDWDDIPKSGISKNSERIGLSGQPLKKKKVLQAYYASVAFMDQQVGRILDELDRLKLRDETIVIFKSDHGYHLGEHEFWQKMSLHEESARIPLIISLPGQRSPQTTDSLVEAIDLYPTLAAQAGLEVPAHCQGLDLSPLWGKTQTKLREFAYCTTGKGVLIRTPNRAFLRHGDGSEELYDMEKDPHQFTNLVKSKNSASVRNQMREYVILKSKQIPTIRTKAKGKN